MSDDLESSADCVTQSMFERVIDTWRADGNWPFPRYDSTGRIVRVRRVIPPFSIQDCEEALL